MNASRRCLALVASSCAALISGCMVGPDYHLPQSAVINASAAQQDFVSSADPALSRAQVPESWWHLYEDRRLDGWVEEALKSNTDLRKADANLERSRAALREARTRRQPSVGVSGGVQYAQLAGEEYLLPVTLPRDKYYDTGLTVSYDLDLFGGIRRGIEAARADDEAVEAARDLVRVNVAAETIRAYADACGAGLQLEAAVRSLTVQQQSLDLTERLFQGGRTIDLDVTRARQLVDQQRGLIPTYEAARRNALFRLATLTGKPPALFDRELEACSAPPRLTRALPVGDGAALLKRRPDVRQAERQFAAATANIGVQTAQLYPDVAIGGEVGSTGLVRDAYTSPTNLWNVGVVLKWQVNQNAARARIQGANAAAKLALANFDGVVLAALRDAEIALNTYVHDLQREDSTRKARDEAERAVRDSEKLQAAGRATALVVTDAQRAYAASEQTLAQLETAIAQDQVAVFLALGGGWGEETASGASAVEIENR
jgi:NodT family efflux transporter outer membrane factor (OMF) lipoprotein